jgi:hypothetical protein
MKKLFPLLMMVALSITATSCYYDELPAVPLPENVSYQKNIQPLFNKNCIGCHKPGATAPDLTSANSYLSLVTVVNGEAFVIPSDAKNSILYEVMTGNGALVMPANGALSASKQALVEKWINDGALNN